MTEGLVISVLGACASPECSLSKGGDCHLGFEDPFECENFEPEEADDAVAAPLKGSMEEIDQLSGESNTLSSIIDERGRNPWLPADVTEPIHSGEALTLEEASEVMKRATTAVVVPIGSAGVGKTTLVTAVYEELGKRALAGWEFAGSQSLVGFERRSFLATRASARLVSDTPRTSQATSQLLLHLALTSESGVPHNLLFADISGEQADALRRYNEFSDYAPILRSATCILIMIDGARLADEVQRYAAVSEAVTLFRAVRESGFLRSGVNFGLIATKRDLYSEVDVQSLLEPLLNEMSTAESKPTLLQMAVRPDSMISETGDRIENFMALIMETRRVENLTVMQRLEHGRSSHRYRGGSAVLNRYLGVVL